MMGTAKIIGVANDGDPRWIAAIKHLSQFIQPSTYVRTQPGAVFGEENLRTQAHLDPVLTPIDPRRAAKTTGRHRKVTHEGTDIADGCVRGGRRRIAASGGG